MAYERTEEIRKKQSDAARRNHMQHPEDRVIRTHTLNETIRRKKDAGEVLGRPSAALGGVYTKRGCYRPCQTCTNQVYYTPRDILLNKVKCCSIPCKNNNPLFLDKMRTADKSYMQTEEYKSTKRKIDTTEYSRYKNAVHRKTRDVYEKHIDLINPMRHPRTLCGIEGGWQLDHIMPIRECYALGIPADIASAVSNLRMLPWRDNLMRNHNVIDV